MRIGFMGTAEFAASILDALVHAGHEVAVVYTRPPKKANRGKITPSAVALFADHHGLPVKTPPSLRDAGEQQAFAAFGLDVAVVAAYGLILPPAILGAPRRGCLNVHASLLPRWRGAAPIERAILAGDEETGVTIMQMEEGLDTGPMLAKAATPVGAKNAGELTKELAHKGGALLLDVLARAKWRPVPQPEAGATYAAKIRKEEARIDWSRPAAEIARLVRAMQPRPGAWFERAGAAGQKERVKLIAATVPAIDAPSDLPTGAPAPGTWLGDGLITTGAGLLRLDILQPAGGKEMPVEAFLRGHPLAPGATLR